MGPFAYLLTGCVIIIFLIDLLAKVTVTVSKRKKLFVKAAKIGILLFMVFVVSAYVVPGIML